MPLISLETINGTPAFVSTGMPPGLERIHAGILDAGKRRYIYPAYPPFGQVVVDDFRKVLKSVSFSAEAEAQIAWLEKLPQRLEDRTLPRGFTFVTKPFEHQVEALAHVLNFPRFALYFDAGTGKTKVLVDLKRCFPGKRMLVLTPKITVQTWVREINLHSGGALRAVVVSGTPEQKRSILVRSTAYDVVIASYGTARNLGHPRLYAATDKALQAAQLAGVRLSESGQATLVRSIRLLSDPDRQLHLALAWALGAPLNHISQWAEAEAKQHPQWLKDIEYNIIVADESHNLNNISSQQTKVALGLAKQASRRYLMSGTPTLGDPRHLYAQMKFLSPAIIPEDWFKFSDMFLVRSSWNKHIVTGFKNIHILNARVQRIAIRKTKEECLDLPERSIITVPVVLTTVQKDLYNTLIIQMQANLQEYFKTNNTLAVQNAAVLLNKLAQITSGFIMDSQRRTDICDTCHKLIQCVDASIQPYTARCERVTKAPPGALNAFKENPKLDILEGLLEEILANDESKVIVWGLYHAELDAITTMLTKLKIPFVRGGEGNVQQRIDTFNNDLACRVYVGQVASGVGITLNAATYMIYFSLPWSLGHYLQSIDRNYRVGQTKKVVVYLLIGENTVDSFKATALQEKKDLSVMLTKRLACATCEHQLRCLTQDVVMYDPTCIYKHSVQRTIATAELLE